MLPIRMSCQQKPGAPMVKPWISSYHLMLLYIPENQGQEQINFVRADKIHVIKEISSRTKEAYNTILEVCYSKGPRSSLTIYNKLSKYIVYIGF
jgi:hypothetical protein